ncbi:hypothetical protein SAMN05444722_1674 [Rhodovulum sp. ES.010]|nr:hypothetical protein [Rhodovulum sp. ES.010]SIO36227.1 hypothetical protein SAMN05444722_1674 [Rhodovulum sp. ES.010]
MKRVRQAVHRFYLPGAVVLWLALLAAGALDRCGAPETFTYLAP